MSDEDNAGGQQCSTEGCGRDATHHVVYTGRRRGKDRVVCIPCLESLEEGMNAVVDDRREIEVECL